MTCIQAINQRTNQQNKALHVGMELIAQSLNDAGSDMKAVFEAKQVSVPWTAASIKECLVRPLIQAMYQTDSTTELQKTEVNQVWVVLLKHLTENNLCEYVEFPQERQL